MCRFRALVESTLTFATATSTALCDTSQRHHVDAAYAVSAWVSAWVRGWVTEGVGE